MGHIPHVLAPGPWADTSIGLPDVTQRHLGKVVRLRDGEPVSYTDGEGTIGRGVYRSGSVVRGDETQIAPATPTVILACAPPRSSDRARFLVEKATELAVNELYWLRSRHGQGRVPRGEKAQAWIAAATEQSRGAWLTRLAGNVDIADVTSLADASNAPLLVAHPGGRSIRAALFDGVRPAGFVVVIGPERGFRDDEIPHAAVRVGLGERVLRVETAAVAAVAAIRLD